jgi:hypothetical protein
MRDIYVKIKRKVMSVQQIKMNINDLVNRIEDEDKLQACYLVIATIAQDDKEQPKPKTAKPRTSKKNKTLPSHINGVDSIAETAKSQEPVVPHDLSLVFLANDVFKGAEPLSEAGEIAFDKAFKKSLKKESSLPNRL